MLGAGHAGKLALAAARDAAPDATLVAVDYDAVSVERVRELGLCDIAVATDLRDPLAAIADVAAAGAPPADLTVVVVNATALRADVDPAHRGRRARSCSSRWRPASPPPRWRRTASASSARMLVGSGYTDDRGAYAIDLVRRSEPLRRAFGLVEETV